MSCSQERTTVSGAGSRSEIGYQTMRDGARERTRGGRRGQMTAPFAQLPRPLSDSVIVERVFAAVMEHKLPSGAKLAENALCEAFDASRAQIRRVLVVLPGRRVATLHPNRCAYG